MATPTAPIGSFRPPPNVNPSPRQRFQESQQNIAKHRELIQIPEFQRACDYTVMHMNWLLAQDKSENFNAHAANAMKMVGVHEFLALFRTLAESIPQSPKIVDRDNLVHNT